MMTHQAPLTAHERIVSETRSMPWRRRTGLSGTAAVIGAAWLATAPGHTVHAAPVMKDRPAARKAGTGPITASPARKLQRTDKNEAVRYLLAQNTVSATATAAGGGGTTPPPGAGSSASGSFSIVANGIAPSTPAELVKVLAIALNDSRIKIDVASLPGGRYIAALSGAVHPADKSDLVETVRQLNESGIATVINRVKYDADLTAKEAAAKKDPPDATEVWPLTFLPSPLGTTIGGATQYEVTPLVAVLNGIYAKDPAKPPVQPARQALILRGSSELRNDIKRQLVLIDAPGPQVQLDVWALQMSGKRGPKFEAALKENMDLIRRVQSALPAVPVELYVALAKRAGYRRVPLPFTAPGRAPAIPPPPPPPPPYPAIPAPPAPLFAPPPAIAPINDEFYKRWNYWIDQMIVEQLRTDLNDLGYSPEPRNSTSLNNALILLSLEDRVGCDAIISQMEDKADPIVKGLGLFDEKKAKAEKRDKVYFRSLRTTYDVPERWDGKTDAWNYGPSLFPERETIRIFIEAVMAYRATAKGEEGRTIFRKRLGRKLEQVIAQPNFQAFPDYSDLYRAWKKRETDPDDDLVARTDVRYQGKVAEGLTYRQKADAERAALVRATSYRPDPSGGPAADYEPLLKKTAEYREALTLEYLGARRTQNERNQADLDALAIVRAAAGYTPPPGGAADDRLTRRYREEYARLLEGMDTKLPTTLVALKKERLLDDKMKELLLRAPEDLRRTAAATDSLLKIAVDAFTNDMQEIFLRPTLEKVMGKKLPNNGGVSLAGRSRLVVTSGLETRLAPTLVAHVETTRPAPMSKATLDMAFPGKKTDNHTTTTTTTVKADGTTETTGAGSATNASGFEALTGTAQILAGLNPAQAILLAGALNPPTPTFTRVAPGVGINVRPSVMPDGGAARLQVDMNFGVDATAVQDDDAQNVLHWPVADSVKAHTVTTDAIVSSFDLFDISSFNLTTSYPRPPGYIPVLGTLPVIGKVFQWRRKNTQIEHHSMILVNTVILPRSLDIVQLYGGTAP